MGIRVYDETTKQFVRSTIKEIFDTGKKECFELVLEDGKKLTCTEEHKVYNMNGFVKLKDCKVGDAVAVFSCEQTILYKYISSITSVGIKQTYDIEVHHDSHNYVANGIVTHNSQRYASIDDTAIEVPQLRRQDTKNRQNSIDDIPDINEAFHERIEKHFAESLQLYRDLLEQGVAKECARFVLPLCTKTRMYMSGTIRSFIHYCQVRCHESTQKEHRDIAMQVREILLDQLPSLRDILEVETKV
jgi:hypothetical protein